MFQDPSSRFSCRQTLPPRLNFLKLKSHLKSLNEACLHYVHIYSSLSNEPAGASNRRVATLSRIGYRKRAAIHPPEIYRMKTPPSIWHLLMKRRRTRDARAQSIFHTNNGAGPSFRKLLQRKPGVFCPLCSAFQLAFAKQNEMR